MLVFKKIGDFLALLKKEALFIVRAQMCDRWKTYHAVQFMVMAAPQSEVVH